MKITGQLLRDWGIAPGPWFPACIAAATVAFAETGDEMKARTAAVFAVADAPQVAPERIRKTTGNGIVPESLPPITAEPFEPFPKIARLNRNIVITEKIDGTNAQVWISDDCSEVVAGSRNRWLRPGRNDNYGFAGWVAENRADLLNLGPGRHFGEWWGSGIQSGYGLPAGERRFSLFNVSRWAADGPPACCSLVPLIYSGVYEPNALEVALMVLRVRGSMAAPGFMRPEGIVVFHSAAGRLFKVLLENDDVSKGEALERAA